MEKGPNLRTIFGTNNYTLGTVQKIDEKWILSFLAQKGDLLKFSLSANTRRYLVNHFLSNTRFPLV